jgi:hypothetical protein
MADGIENVVVIGLVSASQPCRFCTLALVDYGVIDTRHPYRTISIKTRKPRMLLV